VVGTVFLKEMGQRLMSARKSLGITQEELAERVGVSTQMISNLELGKKAIRPENLVNICQELGLSTDFVLMGSNINTEVDGIAEKLIKLTPDELKIINDIIDYMNRKR